MVFILAGCVSSENVILDEEVLRFRIVSQNGDYLFVLFESGILEISDLVKMSMEVNKHFSNEEMNGIKSIIKNIDFSLVKKSKGTGLGVWIVYMDIRGYEFDFEHEMSADKYVNEIVELLLDSAPSEWTFY